MRTEGMNKRFKRVLITVFAIIGVCAVLYFFWQMYQQHIQEERARAFINGPAQAYKPGTAPPPPQ
jgi:hypothetical protein